MEVAETVTIVSDFTRPWLLVLLAFAMFAFCGGSLNAQVSSQSPRASSNLQTPAEDPQVDQHAEAELRTGIALTSKGQFAEAIPHLAAAKGHVHDDYAAQFNLALCYVGTNDFRRAIDQLNALRENGIATANVENLLAQAYIGDQQPDPAFKAFQRAASLTPKNEKLYLLVSDACADRQDYALGIRIVDAGLSRLPDSAHLHYQRGYFLSMLDQFDAAKTDFDFAIKQAPHAEIGFVAAAQKALFAGNLDEAISTARQAARENRANYLVLTVLGEALIRSGARPGQPEFLEATEALNAAVTARPTYASAQISFSYALLLSNSTDLAIQHLEIGRQLDPKNPAVYSHLAVAYRKIGKRAEEQRALATLKHLNAEQAARIYSAPGDRKSIPGASSSVHP